MLIFKIDEKIIIKLLIILKIKKMKLFDYLVFLINYD